MENFQKQNPCHTKKLASLTWIWQNIFYRISIHSSFLLLLAIIFKLVLLPSAYLISPHN